ncbi:50S ribosome-binding GTPase [soil metagenome]
MSSMEGRAVRTRVAGLLDAAQRRYADTAAAPLLREAVQRIDAPLRVALAGKVKAGKSTLLNALVGEQLAATDAGECTRIVTWYRDGLTYRVTAHDGDDADAPSHPLSFQRGERALTIDLAGRDPAAIDHLVIEWPSTALQAMTLIDTPGIGSLSADLSARTHAALAPEDRPGAADAVCYLMRHLHASDARFLESFRDDVATTAAPMNAVGVLSRADEIGAGRLAALESAARIARRYRGDPQVRRLCQTVMPVAGLLAETGATLREDEFRALTELVTVDREALQRLLLSADRFSAVDAPTDLDADVRRGLLARLGVFGIRLSLALIRSRQAPTAAALAEALVARSGVAALRKTLLTQFAARADLLKARSGLAVLSAVLTRQPLPGSDDLIAAVEQIATGTHAFAEARLLNALRADTVALDDDAAAEAERLLGGHGDDPASRLGLVGDDEPVHVDADMAREAANAALTRWRRRAEHPLATRASSEVTTVVMRSCEGIVARLAPSRPPR